jgi:hypothetical protein
MVGNFRPTRGEARCYAVVNCAGTITMNYSLHQGQTCYELPPNMDQTPLLFHGTSRQVVPQMTKFAEIFLVN